jgi:hypothetical protein
LSVEQQSTLECNWVQLVKSKRTTVKFSDMLIGNTKNMKTWFQGMKINEKVLDSANALIPEREHISFTIR